VSARLTAALVADLVSLSDAELEPLLERLAPLLEHRTASPPAAPSRFLTSEEAAQLLRSRRRRIYELVADGRLTRHGDGRRLLLARAEVERLAAGQ
jgi:excisionase family DNA binding protein